MIIVTRDRELVKALKRRRLDNVLHIVDPNELDGYFDGMDVVLIPTGEGGFTYVNEMAAVLAGKAGRILVLTLPESWSGKAAEFRRMVDQAPEWQPPPPPEKPMEILQAPEAPADPKAKARKERSEAEEQELIDEVARLNDREYDRRREQTAREMGIRPSQKYLKFQLLRAACSNFCVGYPRMALVPPVLRST
jgi:hypothetical protein